MLQDTQTHVLLTLFTYLHQITFKFCEQILMWRIMKLYWYFHGWASAVRQRL